MKIKVFAVGVILFGFSCSANTAYKGAQVAAGLSGPLAGTLLKSALKSNPDKIVINYDKEVERYQVENHDIVVFGGTVNGKPHLEFSTKYFVASLRRIKLATVYKNMKEINEFNQMDENGKKQQIKSWFMKKYKLNLEDPATVYPPPSH